jgi:hypothetical protein
MQVPVQAKPVNRIRNSGSRVSALSNVVVSEFDYECLAAMQNCPPLMPLEFCLASKGLFHCLR